MPESDPHRDDVELLATDFMERRRRGQCPTIAEYVRKYPHLADEIRELFPTIAAMETLKVAGEHSSDGRASLGGVQLQRLGDFHIVREIGRGGMGVVYEAQQESLDRRVALKVLPRQMLLDVRQLERFRREAQTAGRLHHTNIVPIFGVGEQEGFHYYVMQYIPGVGLDAVIERLEKAAAAGANVSKLRIQTPAPNDSVSETASRTTQTVTGRSYWHEVARAGLQVTEALAYAHHQGVLHRDIKPANLLLDNDGVVWVADFGLAKAMHASDASQTQGLSGTLRYMAPEQFNGTLDARSDLYSLGITLYELLTLKPAFEASDRTKLLQQITAGRLTRPRKIEASIPGDLETIVLKMIAREPGHRYATAQDLAEDLRCYLEDRPIHARRTAAVERLWRWAKRNPAVASLSAAAAVLVLLVAVVATTGYVRTNAALQREAQQRRLTQANADLAMEALDRIFERFGPASGATFSELTVGGTETDTVKVANPPILSTQAAALLEEMLPFYERLAAQAANDTVLRRKIAAANRRVGDLRQRLGQYAQAAESYARAVELYQAMDVAGSDAAAVQIEIARIENETGNLHRAQGETAEAQAAHNRALAILEPTMVASAGAATDADARFELARTYHRLGSRSAPEPGAQLQRPREDGSPARGAQRPLPPRGQGPSRRPGQRAFPPPRRGQNPRPDGPPPDDPPEAAPEAPPESLEHMGKAVALLEALVAQYPKRPAYRHLLAMCYRQQAQPGRDDTQAMDRAVALLEQLVTQQPNVPDYRYDLSEIHAAIDIRRLRRGDDTDAALKRLATALTISEKLVREHPYVPQYLASQAQIHHKLSAVHRRGRRMKEAIESQQKALAIYTSLVERFPSTPTYTIWLAAIRLAHAEVLMRRGDSDQAQTDIEQTITMLEGLLRDRPELTYIHGLLEQANMRLADVLTRAGKTEAARAATQRAKQHRKVGGQWPVRQ